MTLEICMCEYQETDLFIRVSKRFHRDPRPPRPNCYIFMQFSGKIKQNNRLRLTTPAPYVWEILDLPLSAMLT